MWHMVLSFILIFYSIAIDVILSLFDQSVFNAIHKCILCVLTSWKIISFNRLIFTTVFLFDIDDVIAIMLAKVVHNLFPTILKNTFNENYLFLTYKCIIEIFNMLVVLCWNFSFIMSFFYPSVCFSFKIICRNTLAKSFVVRLTLWLFILVVNFMLCCFSLNTQKLCIEIIYVTVFIFI